VLPQLTSVSAACLVLYLVALGITVTSETLSAASEVAALHQRLSAMEMHQVSYFLVVGENGYREAISTWVRSAIFAALVVGIIFCGVAADLNISMLWPIPSLIGP
jgi:hypothetical protein